MARVTGRGGVLGIRVGRALRSGAFSLLLGAALGAQAEESPAAGGEGCSQAVALQTARRIQAHYEKVRDLRADFEQTSTSATFEGEPLASAAARRGRVVFAKPGRMRWTYEPPEASVVVSDGTTLWIHDLDARTVTRLAVTEGYLSGAALQFLMGDGQILETFTVEATQCDDQQVALELIPRADASYERLGLVVEARTGRIRATSVADLFGNVTRIRFDRLEEDRRPAPATFQFAIPAGVEVIDYSGGPSPGPSKP